MQYACAALPGRQLGVDLPPESFSSNQQRQIKLDGGVELDGSTRRALLPVKPAEPWGHVAEARLRASAEQREPRHPYTYLPITKCQLSMYTALQVAVKLWQNVQLEWRRLLGQRSSTAC